MAEIRVQKIPSPSRDLSKRELYATVCYFYPQYTLKDAAKLPARDVQLLLKVAMRQQSATYLNLTQIAAAPHTEKGEGVKNLIDLYKEAAR